MSTRPHPIDADAGPITLGLPVALTSFVGREREIARLERALTQHRLITLVGAGGSGKTRLAAALLGTTSAEGRMPSVWIELAPLATGGLLAAHVASALRVREQPGTPLQDTLIDALADRPLLLALDNCEHLIDECAAFVEALLSACPALRVLATSRQSLGVPGEKTWPVPPLGLPQDGDSDAAAIGGAEAVRLFAQRAADSTASFQLTDANAKAVARICRRLDGLPLALELAAARVRLMPPEQLASRLDDVFAVLGGANRSALPRHRTLRALIDWSYDLLSEQERRLFGRFAIFAGGFTLEAAEGVTGCDGLDAHEVLDLLAALVDKSLVVMRERDGEARYTLLETVRQYAAERLGAEPEAECVRTRHARYYLQLAEQAYRELRGAQQMVWLARLDAEHDNLRTALARAIAVGDSDTALRTCVALHDFWRMRGHLAEGRGWLEQALALPGADDGVRAHALTCAGNFARMQGAHELARALHGRAVDMARVTDARVPLALALTNLGSELRLGFELDAAAPLLEEAMRLSAETGDRRTICEAAFASASLASARGEVDRSRELRSELVESSRRCGDLEAEARALLGLGEVARQAGDLEAGRSYNLRAIALYNQFRDTWNIAAALHNLGWIEAGLGNQADAWRRFAESYHRFSAAGNRIGSALCLAGLARVLHERADSELAARALATAYQEFTREGVRPAPADWREWQATRQAIERTLEPAVFLRAWGRTLGNAMHTVSEILERWTEPLLGLDAAPCSRTAPADAVSAPALGGSAHSPGGSAHSPGGSAHSPGGSAHSPGGSAHSPGDASPPGAGQALPAQPLADLRIEALGTLRVHVRGELLPAERWGSARPRELLVFLADDPRGRTRDEVGRALWPDATPAQASNSFHVTLYRLRKALGQPEWIPLVDERYRIAPDVRLDFDAHRFEHDVRQALQDAAAGQVVTARLEAALALYRGELLEDQVVGEWCREARDRLRALCIEALLTLGADHYAAGRVDAATEAYRRAVALDDVHEEAYRRLMLCLAATGMRAEALVLFQRLSALLRDELDASPEPETLELHERLRTAAPLA